MEPVPGVGLVMTPGVGFSGLGLDVVPAVGFEGSSVGLETGPVMGEVTE